MFFVFLFPAVGPASLTTVWPYTHSAHPASGLEKKNESQKQALKDSKDTYLIDQGSTCEEKRQKDSNRGEIWQNFSAQFLFFKKKKKKREI